MSENNKRCIATAMDGYHLGNYYVFWPTRVIHGKVNNETKTLKELSGEKSEVYTVMNFDNILKKAGYIQVQSFLMVKYIHQ